MDDSLVYLNGQLTPLSDAKISVLDRGFIFGDGVYEVIPMYHRQLFRADQHFARLFRSMRAISLLNPHAKEEWMELVRNVTGAHASDQQLVYIQVTRGVAKRGHAFPEASYPTVFIMTNPLVTPSEDVRAQGVACVSMEDSRWLHCDIKSISLLGNVLAAQYAAEHDAVETIQFRDGFLTEGASSNVWVVRHGRLMAPPKDKHILEGIRYGLIEELCAACGIMLEVRHIARAEVFHAEEILITSAGKEILPVASIDGHPVGSGKPGPVFQRLYAAYQQAKPRPLT
ncbi:D-amino acid aminotransferase [Oxalobacteraceae bacterium R-40]|uniref:D-amino acid aminotransferase n=1 Tax=Keguizhuia sedimenti TaxID=3064264 RepID=A0ABU1BJJ7_9BURK|nr:D-amino acid aminotransferase [Oxalobacteraceae bacterium R-40]